MPKLPWNDENPKKSPKPQGPGSTEILIDALRAQLTPMAIAVVARHLQTVKLQDRYVARELRRFIADLVQALGGPGQVDQLVQSVGMEPAARSRPAES